MNESLHILRILLIEDNPGDICLVQEALREHALECELETMSDGETAIRAIEQLDSDDQLPCPDLILLDLQLPRANGAEILQCIRRSRRAGDTPVIITTSSDHLTDKVETEKLKANHYFRKPPELEAYLVLGAVVREVSQKIERFATKEACAGAVLPKTSTP